MAKQTSRMKGKGRKLTGTGDAQLRGQARNLEGAGAELERATGISKLNEAGQRQMARRAGVDADQLKRDSLRMRDASLGGAIAKRRTIASMGKVADQARRDAAMARKLKARNQAANKPRNRTEAARKAALTRKMRGK